MMWKLQVVFEGLVFIYQPVGFPANGATALLLSLPGCHAMHSKNSRGGQHSARLRVAADSVETTREPVDTTGEVQSYSLEGEHLGMLFSAPPVPPRLEVLSPVRPGRKPARKEERPSYAWVQPMSHLLTHAQWKGLPNPSAVLIRDVVNAIYPGGLEGLLLARMELAAGTLRTYQLWGENDPNNEDLDRITGYCFPAEGNECAYGESPVAVAKSVALELAMDVDAKVELTTRPLDIGGNRKPGFVIAPRRMTPEPVTVTISSDPPSDLSDEDRAGHIDAYYQLLRGYGDLVKKPVPVPIDGSSLVLADINGACSPRNGGP
jgi:hypothetical protein